MSTNHYLDILGLEPGADKKAIKKAYRNLSKRFHPDLNPNPEAHQRFIEINEAYKFLTMAGPSPYASDNSTAYDYDPYQKAYDEWRKQAKEFARAKAEKLAAQRKKTILTTLNFFKYFAAIVLIFSSILIVDFFLPEVESEVKVYQIIVQRINYDKYVDEKLAFDMAEKIVVTDHSELTVIGHLDQSIENYLTAFVHHTPIFKKPTTITFEVEDSLQRFKVVQQIYQTFSFFVWVNFFLSIAFFFLPVNPTLKLNFAIVMSVFFILEIIVAVF